MPGTPFPGCRLPVTLTVNSLAVEAHLSDHEELAERLMALAAEQLRRVVACTENGLAVAVMADSTGFEEPAGYVITPALAAELVKEGRLKWIQ